MGQEYNSTGLWTKAVQVNSHEQKSFSGFKQDRLQLTRLGSVRTGA